MSENKADSKIIHTDAKQYENIAKRTKIVDNQETRDLLLNDTYKAIEIALDKDGSTGKLSNPDGIVKGAPVMYRGFFIQCFGYVHYESELDIYGKMKWYGFARIVDKGRRIQFDAFKKSSEHEAGRELFMLVDAYYGTKVIVN